MNVLLEEREKFLKEKEELEGKIKSQYSELSVLRRKINVFENEIKVMLEEKDKLLQPSELGTLLCIKVEFSGPFYTASEYWDYYFYDYSKGIIVSERVFEGCHHKYNVFQDIRDHLIIDGKIEKDKLDDLEYMEKLLREIIDSFVDRYNPNSWKELKEIVDKSIQDGTFFEELYKNKDKVRSLSKDI